MADWLIITLMVITGFCLVCWVLGAMLLASDEGVRIVGVLLTFTLVATGLFMFVAIRYLGCCGEPVVIDRGVVIEKNIFNSGTSRLSGNTPDSYWLKLQNETGWFWVDLGDSDYMRDYWKGIEVGVQCVKQGRGYLAWECA